MPDNWGRPTADDFINIGQIFDRANENINKQQDRAKRLELEQGRKAWGAAYASGDDKQIKALLESPNYNSEAHAAGSLDAYNINTHDSARVSSNIAIESTRTKDYLKKSIMANARGNSEKSWDHLISAMNVVDPGSKHSYVVAKDGTFVYYKDGVPVPKQTFESLHSSFGPLLSDSASFTTHMLQQKQNMNAKAMSAATDGDMGLMVLADGTETYFVRAVDPRTGKLVYNDFDPKTPPLTEPPEGATFLKMSPAELKQLDDLKGTPEDTKTKLEVFDKRLNIHRTNLKAVINTLQENADADDMRSLGKILSGMKDHSFNIDQPEEKNSTIAFMKKMAQSSDPEEKAAANLGLSYMTSYFDTLRQYRDFNTSLSPTAGEAMGGAKRPSAPSKVTVSVGTNSREFDMEMAAESYKKNPNLTEYMSKEDTAKLMDYIKKSSGARQAIPTE